MSIYIFSTASNGTANKRQRDANSTTLMLIVVIAIFLTVEIPLMVITALHTISSRYILRSFFFQIINRILTIFIFLPFCPQFLNKMFVILIFDRLRKTSNTYFDFLVQLSAFISIK